jgi:cyclopropane-fatty-acyl-phospholipid synthase
VSVARLGQHLEFLQDVVGDHAARGFAVRLWDGTTWEPETGSARFTLVFDEPAALRALLRPSERRLAEAYLHGGLDIEGDIEAVFPLADHLLLERPSRRAGSLAAGFRLLSRSSNGRAAHDGTRPAQLRGRRFSLERDRQAVDYHYGRSNEFFRLFLDDRLCYSCAYWTSPDDTLERAQARKLDYVCRKLRLEPGERLLDIGCGWGALSVHAAARYGADVLGITLSERQAEFARERIAAAGVADHCRVEVRDYRELDLRESFDKIASVGMFEHVAAERLPAYFRKAWELLRPRGVFLNHGIARAYHQPPRRGPSFVMSYVYPDAELSPISTALAAAEEAGFEVRDVESVREHYPPTLREWLRRLEARRDDAVRETDEVNYRVFRLYLAGAAHGFSNGRLSVFQALLVKPDERGGSGLPLTREDWYG